MGEGRMSTHSQAPWTFFSNRNDAPITITDGQDNLIASLFHKNESIVTTTREQALFNAHLIVAAPDLLAFAKKYNERMSGQYNWPDDQRLSVVDFKLWAECRRAIVIGAA